MGFCWDITSIILGSISYVVDVSLDFVLAYSHGSGSDRNWMIVTIVLILLPGIVNGVFTIFTIRPSVDASMGYLSPRMRYFGYVLSCVLLGPVFWDIHAITALIKARRAEKDNRKVEKDEWETRAKDSKEMGRIERGVEAALESIPQWTAQIYIIGITNKISVIQIVSLGSSLLTATFCVIEATRAIISTLADFRGQKGGALWGFSFYFFGLWMFLAMMVFLVTTALFSAVHGGALIFLFFILFYVEVIGQFGLLVKWKSKEFSQRVSIVAQLVIFAVSFYLIEDWRSQTAPIKLKIFSEVRNRETSLQIAIASHPNFTLGWKQGHENPTDVEIGSFFNTEVKFQVKKKGVNETDYLTSQDFDPKDKATCVDYEQDGQSCIRHFYIRLTLTEDLTRTDTRTRFLARICNVDRFKWSDITSMMNNPSGLIDLLSTKDVMCLSENTDDLRTALRVFNYVWLMYHIFLVISLDWIFWNKKGETSDENTTATTMAPITVQRDVYVEQNDIAMN